MTPRDIVLAGIRRSLGVTGVEATRRLDVAARLGGHPSGVVPAREQLPPAARLDLFARMVASAAGTVEHVHDYAAVPEAAAMFLRRHNLPLRLRHGNDPRLAGLAWEPTLEVRRGPSDGTDFAAVSHALVAVAETGTVVLVSGADNPTTLNFLPDVHIVVVRASDILADFETAMTRLREHYGAGALPRAVNLITGPSRSADIEQTLIVGAHGPRKLHVIVIAT